MTKRYYLLHNPESKLFYDMDGSPRRRLCDASLFDVRKDAQEMAELLDEGWEVHPVTMTME